MTTIESKNSEAGTPIPDEIVVRSCNGMDELQACTDLEKQIWNFSDRDVVPRRLNVVAQHVGGQVIGAFDDGNLAGFAMSLPGVHNGRPYLHSRALAVSEKYRNAGLGRKLKLFQREDALAKGFDLIEWTFDPLEIKNAYLNIERLGHHPQVRGQPLRKLFVRPAGWPAVGLTGRRTAGCVRRG